MTAFIIANGSATKFRGWGDCGPNWTSSRERALKFADRESAEKFARDDEDAWAILPYDLPYAATAWRPIDEAPRDGSRVLVGRAGFNPCMASWPTNIASPSWPSLSPTWTPPGEVVDFRKPTHFAVIHEPPAAPA